MLSSLGSLIRSGSFENPKKIQSSHYIFLPETRRKVVNHFGTGFASRNHGASTTPDSKGRNYSLSFS
jgi:hypothetical protein